MARLKNPLHSLDASGKLGPGIRYASSRGMARGIAKRGKGGTAGLGQQRQSSIISEAGRLWRTRSGAGPEATYQEYVGNISRNNWYFMTGAVLLEWNAETMMVAE